MRAVARKRGFGERVRREVDFAGGVDGVDNLPRGKRAAEAVSDLLGRLRRHRHADEICVAAYGEVIGHYLDGGNDPIAVGRLTAELDDLEIAEEIGKVPAGDFAKDCGFAIGQVEASEAVDESAATCCARWACPKSVSTW